MEPQQNHTRPNSTFMLPLKMYNCTINKLFNRCLGLALQSVCLVEVISHEPYRHATLDIGVAYPNRTYTVRCSCKDQIPYVECHMLTQKAQQEGDFVEHTAR
jgi:hypothetical protein